MTSDEPACQVGTRPAHLPGKGEGYVRMAAMCVCWGRGGGRMPAGEARPSEVAAAGLLLTTRPEL